jgi:hypothetical protein
LSAGPAAIRVWTAVVAMETSLGNEGRCARGVAPPSIGLHVTFREHDIP